MNYKSLAGKGRYGDSEIRNVAGRESHVNKREAGLIDALGIKGEALTQILGSGTTNPMTGLPEYHYKWTDELTGGHEDEHRAERRKKWEQSMFDQLPDRFDKNRYSQAVQQGQGKNYLRSLGIPENKLSYFETNINMDQPGFLKESLDIFKKENLAQVDSLALQTGTSLSNIYNKRDEVMVGSGGIESSGSVNYATQKAEKGVLQGYIQQRDSLTASLEKADLNYRSGMSDFGQQLSDEFWENAGIQQDLLND